MKTPISLLLVLTLFFTASHLHASATEDAAKKVKITVQLKEIRASEIGQYISNLSAIKVVNHLPKDKDPVVTLNLKDVSAQEALNMVAKLADVKITYADDAVHLQQK